MNNYADDCAHLKACRRLSKIAKDQTGKTITRYCSENCSAYEGGPLYTREQVEAVKYGAARDGAEGYSGGDLLISDYI